MDLATLIGLIGAISVIVGAIVVGGSAGTFFNVPSLLIVVGGTVTSTLIKFPVAQFVTAFKTAGRAFSYKSDDPRQLIATTVELAQVARKEGLLALESYEVDNPFLQKGIQLVADGHEPDFVKKVLTQEIDLQIERHEQGENVFRALGDVAPAMGMIGTLIGLVQMLSNMDDPKQIGPAMAIALLTTLYGAVMANAIFLPIADKLGNRNEEERVNRTLILEGLVSIQEGLNPRVIEELLKTYLPGNMRDSLETEAA
ncbi:flagellar motor protein PomA [Alkalilimnicola sp. S0819]|uniref:flagellar motor protein PomA n=1 Tax=Alkalilimnicola sp. S0819 TaxID=2613922 RepID=UPI0012629105|nr:flagellar motor protein PomA [Alkalilimnicola sp. S0819]KAB7622629.1 flagellar motor protein PomA [Alkalilimnicola sp. S0819]MPQ17400.1 flagellar motor protein PomA [Alkalilimnicola sp. S0819]